MIGRGRNGWEFDADGQGSLAEVGNAAVLGTTGAFAPAMYSEATIQSLLTNSGADMTGAEIRIRRATDVAGTDPYQEARWRPVSQTNWRSNFDLDTNYAIEHEVISGPGSPLGPVATNTRDTNPQSGNDYTRIFTWGWGNHGGQKGFSYGQPISGVANNDPDTFLWEFADENHAIPYSELYIRLESPTAPSLPDSDGDGLADLVEMALAGNLDDLTAGDDDDDGLTSADEYYLHGTDPLVADTDGDGLNDGGEIAAGTSAFNADTDGDGLTDAQEVNGPPVTNPLNPDTDGDTWFDLFEIEKGSDPNDINSVPAPDPLHLLGYWEFNDVDDAANAVDSANGYVGQVLGGAAYTPDAGGRTGAPGDYGMDFGVSSANQYVLVPDGSIVNEAFLFDEVTIAFWQKLAQPASTTAFKAASPSSSGAQRGIRAHAPWGDNIIYFDTAGCCEIPGQRLQNAVPDGTDFTQWHHFAFVKNGDVKEIWLNGELVVSQPGAAPLPFDITELTLGSSTGGAESIQGIMDDYALFSRALTPEQIALLAEGTSAIDLVILLAWLVLLVPSRGKAKLGQLECARLKLTWNKEIFIVLGITFATILGWLTQNTHGWSTGTVSLIPLIVFFGSKILNIRDLRSLSWDVLLLMGGGLCLGTAISASGLAGWIVGFLPSSMLSTYPAAITFGIAACLMSCLMSNTATANLVMPMIAGLALDQNAPVLLTTAVACSIAMALPVSTPPNAMAFASEEIRVSDLLKPGILITLASLIVALTLGFWWWGFLGVG
ncbi:SLC13 family permease [bacterium]|nr:SLC13 family permease [bacterium]